MTELTKPAGDYSWTEPESEASVDNPPVYPFNRVVSTESGHTFEMDDTQGRERIRLQHGGAKTGGQGSFFEMQSTGDKVEKIVGTNYEIIAKDNNVLIRGVCNITVEGDSVLHVKGNKFERIDGDLIQEVRGTYTQNLKKKATVICDGDMVMGVGDPATGTMRLSVGDHLYLDGDLLVAGSINADMITAETKVNAGTGVTAGPLGFATLLGGVSAGLPVAIPGQMNSSISVNSPLVFGLVTKDVIGSMAKMRFQYNRHKHPTPKGMSGPPTVYML
jgi:hypothetical protein